MLSRNWKNDNIIQFEVLSVFQNNYDRSSFVMCLRVEGHNCDDHLHGYMETMAYGNFKIVLEFSVKILIVIAVNFRYLS